MTRRLLFAAMIPLLAATGFAAARGASASPDPTPAAQEATPTPTPEAAPPPPAPTPTPPSITPTHEAGGASPSATPPAQPAPTPQPPTPTPEVTTTSAPTPTPAQPTPTPAQPTAAPETPPAPAPPPGSAETPPVSAATPEGAVTLHAQQQQFIEGQLWCGWGNVEIHYQDITVKCDEMELDQNTLELVATGNVVMDQGPSRLACDRMELNLKTKAGVLYDVVAFFPPNYNFQGAVVERIDATHFRFKDGVFTSCPSGEGAPPWTIKASSGRVELDGYGHFRNASLRVKGVPVLYLPRLVWPVKRGRAAGLLVPHIGYNGRRGAYLGNSFYWPISRSFDTTLLVDAYSKGYLGLGDEARWAPAENAKGDIFFEAYRNPEYNPLLQPQGSRWEWKLEGKHQQLFSDGWVLRSELHDVSSLDFFQRFERTFDQSAQSVLYSYVTLSRTWGPQTLNLKLDHQKTYLTSQSTTTSVVQLDRLPEAEYRLRATRVGQTPLYVSMVGTADRFRIDRSSTLRGNYERFDLFPTVSLLLPGFSWLNLTPTAGARWSYYSASQRQQTLVQEPITRQYATAGFSLVGPSFSRIWSGTEHKYKHLLEPRVDYTYVSNPGDSAQIPIFDYKDSVVVSNSATWALSNQLFVKTGEAASREVATFEISQAYSFSQPLTVRSKISSQSGPLSFWLRVSPIPTASIDARASLDAITHNLSSTALSTMLMSPTTGVNLTWYSSYDPLTSAPTSSQARLQFRYGPKGAHWQVQTGIAYDIHNAKLLDQQYILRWKGSCWSAYLEARDYRVSPYKTRDYRITIDLTGIGTFLDIRGALGWGGSP